MADLQKMAKAGAKYTLVPARSKRPIGRAWQQRPCRVDKAIAHLEAGGNVGLLAGDPSQGLVMLDVDTRAEMFRKTWPDLCRWRVWRDNAPDRMKVIVCCNGAKPQHWPGFDLLATGTHGVIAGTHETGVEIRIQLDGDAPPGLTVDELDEICRVWTTFLDVVQPPATISQPVSPSPTAHKQFRPIQCNATSTEVAVLLDSLAPHRADDYHEWIRVGHILKHELGEPGLDLWDAWSSQSAKYVADVCMQKWSTFRPDGRVSLTTLRYMADVDTGNLGNRKRSAVDTLLDAVERDVVSGRIRVSANVQKTLFGVLALMRQAGKIQSVALPVRDVSSAAGVAVGTVSRHIAVLVDDGILELVYKSNYTKASEYTLSAKVEHSNAVGGSAAECSTLALTDVIQHYHDLQHEPLCAIRARIEPELVKNAHEAELVFGAGVQRILSWLQAGTIDSVDDLIAATHLSRRTVFRRLSSLRTVGIVEGLRLADDWQEQIAALTPRLVSFGWRDLRDVQSNRMRVSFHDRMQDYRTGKMLEIAQSAEQLAKERILAGLDAVARCNAIRSALGENAPPVRLNWRPPNRRKKIYIPRALYHPGYASSVATEEERLWANLGVLRAQAAANERQLAA